MKPDVSVKIDAKVMKFVLENVQRIAHKKVYIGLFQAQGAGEVTESGITIAKLGAIHEYGSKEAKLPERRWLRGGLDSGINEVHKAMRIVAQGTLEQRVKPEDALPLIGKAAVAAVQRYVRANKVQPPSQKVREFEKAKEQDKQARQEAKKARAKARFRRRVKRLVRTLTGRGRRSAKGSGKGTESGRELAVANHKQVAKKVKERSPVTLIDTGRMLNAVTYTVQEDMKAGPA